MSQPKYGFNKENALVQATDSTASEAGFTARIVVLIQKYGGVTQIARACGFSEGVVRSWRDGRSDPSRARCLALARGLGISLMWLMAGSGAMLDSDDRHAQGHTTSSVDSHRLSDAMRVLQSTLESTGNHLSTQSRAELLSEYYAALDNPDPVARAEGVGEIHQHLLARIRQAGTKA